MSTRPVSSAVFAIVLAACASPAPALRDDGTAVIAGGDTAELPRAAAAQTVLREAAALTIDHGDRYFRIVSSGGIRPGADVVVKVLSDAPAGQPPPGAWDAQAVLNDPAAAAKALQPASHALPSYRPPPGKGLRCTAYGCVW